MAPVALVVMSVPIVVTMTDAIKARNVDMGPSIVIGRLVFAARSMRMRHCRQLTGNVPHYNRKGQTAPQHHFAVKRGSMRSESPNIRSDPKCRPRTILPYSLGEGPLRDSLDTVPLQGVPSQRAMATPVLSARESGNGYQMYSAPMWAPW